MGKLKRVPVVYLAGGMRSNWQDSVKEKVKNAGSMAIFIDPREHGSKDEVEYTSWDLEGVRRADIIFAFLEKDNPNGAGLALEIGYAAGLNESLGELKKKIVFTAEPEFPALRYFGMARACADRCAESLEEGVAALIDTIYWFE